MTLNWWVDEFPELGVFLYSLKCCLILCIAVQSQSEVQFLILFRLSFAFLQCETIVEQHEDEIIEFFAHEKDNVKDKLCSKRTGTFQFSFVNHTSSLLLYKLCFNLSCSVLCRPLWSCSENSPRRALISSQNACCLSPTEIENLGAIMFSAITGFVTAVCKQILELCQLIPWN